MQTQHCSLERGKNIQGGIYVLPLNYGANIRFYLVVRQWTNYNTWH